MASFRNRNGKWQVQVRRNGHAPRSKSFDLVGGWIEDYNENHPHSGLKMRSPREFIAAQTATA